jgi:hypothetical protein
VDDCADEAFPYAFYEPRNLGVFVCRDVYDGSPALVVWHDADGDWQFFCGEPHGDGDIENILLACLEHVVEQDPTLNDLAMLPPGYGAERANARAAWNTFPDRSSDVPIS